MRDLDRHDPSKDPAPGMQRPGSQGPDRACSGARRLPAGTAWPGVLALALAVSLGGATAAPDAVSRKVQEPQEQQEQQEQQERQPTFRADVELVVHDVAVVDPEGEPVSGLTAGDFRVFDDGVAQDIELFLTSEQAPLDVALVLDSSSSITPVAFSVRRAAVTFLERLSVDDCVYVLPFSEEVGPALWGSPADPRTRRFVQGIRVGGGTALYDAILAALDGLRRAPAAPRAGAPETARRRALVLVSDGADEDSQATWVDVMAAAEAAGVPVFTVAVGLANQDSHLEARLRELARNTGGRLIADVEYAALQSAYGDLVALLRGTYLVGYRPGGSAARDDGSLPADGASATGDGGAPAWHEVRIELRRPLFRALHRPGYYRREGASPALPEEGRSGKNPVCGAGSP